MLRHITKGKLYKVRFVLIGMSIIQIAYYNILGVPLLVYLGTLTFITMIIAAVFGLLVMRGKVKFVWHKVFVIITIVLALIHGILAFGSRFIS